MVTPGTPDGLRAIPFGGELFHSRCTGTSGSSFSSVCHHSEPSRTYQRSRFQTSGVFVGDPAPSSCLRSDRSAPSQPRARGARCNADSTSEIDVASAWLLNHYYRRHIKTRLVRSSQPIGTDISILPPITLSAVVSDCTG